MMKIFPANSAERWGLLLFPFKAYLLLAPVGLFLWREATIEQRVRGAFVEAAGRIALGYWLCVAAFAFTAAVCFFIRRREKVAENLIFAGAAFIIMFFLL